MVIVSYPEGGIQGVNCGFERVKNTGQQIAARILKKARSCYDLSSVAAGVC
jgi:type IV secretory pathway TrbL component